MNISTVNKLIASLESAGELSIREQKFLKLAKAYQQLAAENVALKATSDDRRMFIMNGVQLGYIKVPTVETDPALETIRIAVSPQEPTPATDRIVAGIKADGRSEGINFAASRLAAAFNHGFVDKPMAEVFDVVRMILTAKEDLANDPALPEDGLSGEYAEKSMAEWEAALREGAK
ncbi:hypothetical protein [Raoultella ornithinolytica]|uniref:hypothetical protein n=1 Tax=Raoultella ornithinolytica TaxID=54291 RepID=UPI003A4E0E07